MSNYEVGAADDASSACSFTRQHGLPFEVELLRILFQQLLLRRGGAVLLREVVVEERLDHVAAAKERLDEEVAAKGQLEALLGYMAAVIGMSYAECGDAATIRDDEALMLIRELLLGADEAIISLHKNVRLPRHLRNMISGL